MGLQVTSSTANLIEYALDGLTARHQAIASNIANANTVGYRPMKVSFENELSSLESYYETHKSLPENYRFDPVMDYSPAQMSTSANNGLDTNTVMLNQNVVQYEALIKGLSHYLSTLYVAVKEGRA